MSTIRKKRAGGLEFGIYGDPPAPPYRRKPQPFTANEMIEMARALVTSRTTPADLRHRLSVALDWMIDDEQRSQRKKKGAPPRVQLWLRAHQVDAIMRKFSIKAPAATFAIYPKCSAKDLASIRRAVSDVRAGKCPFRIGPNTAKDAITRYLAATRKKTS